MIFLIAPQAIEAMKAWATVIGLIFFLVIFLPMAKSIFRSAKPKKKKYNELNVANNFKLATTDDKIILDNPFRGRRGRFWKIQIHY